MVVQNHAVSPQKLQEVERIKDLVKKFQEISLYFEKDNIYSLIDQIVNNKEIKEIQGKILKE